MELSGQQKAGRNDPCPCGSGKKYKRCCLAQQAATDSVRARQRSASDALTRDMMDFAARKLGDQIRAAWQDFHLTDLPVPYHADSLDQQIFMPYFLFHWDPQRPRGGRGANRRGGLVTRWYEMERASRLSDMDRRFLEQATLQPVSFHEVLWSEPGRRIGLRDILIGTETAVLERLGSRGVERGDILYGQVWNLEGISTLGCMAPIRIPPSWKAEVIDLRKRLQKKVAKEHRDLTGEDLVRYADAIRLTYLSIREGLDRPPQFANTDGDPLVFHTLKFHVDFPAEAFDALAPLAYGQAKAELLEDAEFGKDGKLRSIRFDWRKKGNAKIPSWDNTILGHLHISGHTLTAEVNSENRANRIRAEIEKRLGASAVHQCTTARTVDEMLAKPPRRSAAREKENDEYIAALLRDPEVKRQMQEVVQRQVEDWVHKKIPALGGRTPLQAVREPDGREIVESLLLDWEREADAGAFQTGLRPDFNVVRRMLNLAPAAP
jgi:SEC-C motif/Antitoxin Xre/MbcA/ParS C-terminal toxin-binding domain